MTLLSPWALAGLALLAVPILVHLFARRRTRVLPFPTLRFIAPSRLLPVRTLRLSDPLLLVVRCLIIAAAVFALAQPRVTTAAREQAAADVLARAIVVDTSASMRRPSATGGTPLDAARREAARVAGEADVSVTVESAEPAEEVRGAAEWLRHQAGKREIVVVSDFQLGAIDSSALAAVPEVIGLQFVRVPAGAEDAAAEQIGSATITARAEITDATTTASWTVGGATAQGHAPIVALTADSDSAAARATLDAALRFTAVPRDTLHSIAIVYPDYAQRAELERAARAPDAPWMAAVGARVWEVGPVARMATAEVDGRQRLLLITDVAPGTLESAELAQAAVRALTEGIPPAEREPAMLPDAQIETWRRAPGDVVTPTDETGSFDGRWFWLLALALLAVETVLRRSRRDEARRDTIDSAEERYARVA